LTNKTWWVQKKTDKDDKVEKIIEHSELLWFLKTHPTHFSRAERRDSSPEMMRSLRRPFSDEVTRPDFSKSDTERSRPLRVP